MTTSSSSDSCIHDATYKASEGADITYLTLPIYLFSEAKVLVGHYLSQPNTGEPYSKATKVP